MRLITNNRGNNYLIRRCLDCRVPLLPEDTTYFCRTCEQQRRARIVRQLNESARRVEGFFERRKGA